MAIRGSGPFIPEKHELPQAQVSKPEDVKTAAVAKEALTNQEETSSFSGLPGEVKILIFQALAFDNWYDPSLQRLFTVHSEWQPLIQRALLQNEDKRDLFVSQILEKAAFKVGKIDKSVWNQVRMCAENVKQLDIPLYRNFTDEDLFALCSLFPNLEILRSVNPESKVLTKEGIKNAVIKCKNLVELKLGRECVSDESLLEIIESCSKVKRVDLFRVATLVTFIEKCPALTHLSLRLVYEAGMLLEALFKTCPNLTCFELRHSWNLTEQQLRTFVEQHPHLSHIDLSGIESVTDELLLFMGQTLSQLTYINVSGCNQVTATGIKALVENCPLEHLEVGHPDLGNVLEIIAQHGKSLKEFIVWNVWNSPITETAVSRVVQNCPLKHLTLYPCDQLSDLFLKEVATYLTEIEELVLYSSDLFTKDGLLCVLDHCPKLKKLALYAKEITLTKFLAEQMAIKLPELRELQVPKFESSQALSAFAHANSKLTHLTIHDGSTLDDEAFLHLGENCKMLREVTINNFNARASGVRQLLEKCKLLRRLDCRTKGISLEEELLQKDFPSVDLLLHLE